MWIHTGSDEIYSDKITDAGRSEAGTLIQEQE